MWNKLYSSIDVMQKGLDASWLRNSVIRNNLANVETPNFKSSDVKFEETFAQALYGTASAQEGFGLKQTRAKHTDYRSERGDDLLQPIIVENENDSMRMDGNNVDIEDENTKLAQNTILYNTILYKLNSELSRLRMAINEGR